MTMQSNINQELLRFAVSTAWFCKGCGTLLDIDRAVSFSAAGRPFVLCATCFDRLREETSGMTGIAEVLDGRVLGNPDTRIAAPRPEAVARPIHAVDVKIGARYRIRHSSGFVTVKVLGIVRHNIYSRDYGANLTGSKQRFRCVNEKTGREIVVKSAAKFRSEVTA